MRYHLKIEDCEADGTPLSQALSVIAEGELCDGVLELHYPYDGAEYSLFIGSDWVKSLRFGDTQIELEFKRNETTFCRISGGGVSGNLPIYTHELKILSAANGCNAKIIFSDGEPDGRKTVKNITAYAVK